LWRFFAFGQLLHIPAGVDIRAHCLCRRSAAWNDIAEPVQIIFVAVIARDICDGGCFRFLGLDSTRLVGRRLPQFAYFFSAEFF